MLLKKSIIFVFVMIGTCWTVASAQTAAPAAGGELSGTGGSASYTIGQIDYKSQSSSEASSAEGVQQPYEISIITGAEEYPEISLKYSAYPNPTAGNLMLRIDDSDFSTMQYQLIDLNGKILVEKNFVENTANIDMSDLVTATYFLKVVQGNKEIKVFKIIKN